MYQTRWIRLRLLPKGVRRLPQLLRMLQAIEAPPSTPPIRHYESIWIEIDTANNGDSSLEDDEDEAETGDLLSSENAAVDPSDDATWTGTPPEDWKTGNYNPALKMIYAAWLVFLAFLLTVPTLTGEPVSPIGIWLPWNDPDQENLKLLMFILNFCPTRLIAPLKCRMHSGWTKNWIPLYSG